MTILGGHFAIVMLVESDDAPTEVQDALDAATAEFGLTVHVTVATGGHASADATHLLSVYGPDRTGILAGVAAALAETDANITDLETRLLGADGDDPVYAMVIELVAPDAHDEVARAVSAACEELGVDHTLRAIEAETY